MWLGTARLGSSRSVGVNPQLLEMLSRRFGARTASQLFGGVRREIFVVLTSGDWHRGVVCIVLRGAEVLASIKSEVYAFCCIVHITFPFLLQVLFSPVLVPYPDLSQQLSNASG